LSDALCQPLRRSQASKSPVASRIVG